jgi:hypothetical protein
MQSPTSRAIKTERAIVLLRVLNDMKISLHFYPLRGGIGAATFWPDRHFSVREGP